MSRKKFTKDILTKGSIVEIKKPSGSSASVFEVTELHKSFFEGQEICNGVKLPNFRQFRYTSRMKIYTFVASTKTLNNNNNNNNKTAHYEQPQAY